MLAQAAAFSEWLGCIQYNESMYNLLCSLNSWAQARIS